LMSYGSTAQEIINRTDIESHIAFRELKLLEKLRNFPRSIIQRIVTELNWRTFIQGRFDRIVPYVKYNLPHNVYRNEDLARKNDNFIKTFE
jgi:hypothetical protein